jgi:pimeloyl-ACP methyl ester carboxylesterase
VPRRSRTAPGAFTNTSTNGRRRFERLIPNCELRYLKGLGHTPMSDDPELLAEAIADFAARSSRAPRAAAPA